MKEYIILKRMKQIYIYMLFVTLLPGVLMTNGCTEEDYGASGDAGPVAVQFISDPNILLATTRTTENGSVWVNDDAIGMFMLTAGGALGTDISGEAENKKFIAAPGNPASTASFTPDGDDNIIYYPHTGNVDFIAYYPYAGFGTGAGQLTPDYKYKVSVLSQNTASGLAQTDLLYSKNVTNKEKSNTPVNLKFNHALSKLIIHIKRGTGMEYASFNTLSTTLHGFPTTADFYLDDGKTFDNYDGSGADIVPFKWDFPAGNGYEATYEAILIPQTGVIPGRKATFIIEGREFTWDIPRDTPFTQGKQYTYEITINTTGISVTILTITPWEPLPVQPGITTESSVVYIPPGTFIMGARDDEPGVYEWEKIQHKVTLTQGFYMSKYPVTNEEFVVFLNHYKIAGDGLATQGEYKGKILVIDSRVESRRNFGVNWDDNAKKWVIVPDYEKCPVIRVTWEGAMEYARWIGGTLPTEAQWEYACRAGTTTIYSFGDNAGIIGQYAWCNPQPNDTTTHPVGLKLPNPWGLYDMHGNVWEICYDHIVYNYSPEDQVDPTGPDLPTGNGRVRRGGSYQDSQNAVRSSSRLSVMDGKTSHDIGFRVAFTKQEIAFRKRDQGMVKNTDTNSSIQ